MQVILFKQLKVAVIFGSYPIERIRVSGCWESSSAQDFSSNHGYYINIGLIIKFKKQKPPQTTTNKQHLEEKKRNNNYNNIKRK